MAITINLTYAQGNVQGRPTVQERADIRYAADQWEATFTDTFDINVEVWAVDYGQNFGAMCIPGIVQHNGRTLTRPLAKLYGHLQPQNNAIDLLVIMNTNQAVNWVLGHGANVAIQQGQCSLSTTIMHELCHGLGFVGLCNMNQQNGVYSDVALTQAVQHLAGQSNPNVVIPNHFFPQNLVAGIGKVTPFANLFDYTNVNLARGTTADDGTAFTTGGSITVRACGQDYTVLSQNNFQPFTTCDHITGANYLMNPTTAGQYYATPDDASKRILQEIGWSVVSLKAAEVLGSPAITAAVLANQGFQGAAIADPAIRTAAFADAGFQAAAFADPGFQVAAIADPGIRTAAFANPGFQAAAFANPGFVNAAAANAAVRTAVQQSFQGTGDRTLSWLSPRDWVNQYLR